MLTAARGVILSVLLLSGVASGAVAQGSAASLPARDAARILRSAREAQARFERIRFQNLPWTMDGGSRECDERIGRFCLWHGDDEDDWVPPPEPEAVGRARSSLIATLDSAALRLPRDEWVAGQRVRYLLEAGRRGDAIVAAAECGEPWWCRALAGLALHSSAEFAAADSAFSQALEAMPESERAMWTDLEPILARGDLQVFRRLEREMPDRAERRFWWLADPLWGEPGNDRRTEHYARLVIDRLQDRARVTEGISWGADLREILLRYGNPVGWERVRPDNPMRVHGRTSVISHYAPNAQPFTPSAAILERPTQSTHEEWTRDDPGSHSEYAPAYSDRFQPLEHQTARFVRGDSILMVAAWELDPDSVPEDARTDAALVLAVDERTPQRIVRGSVSGRRGMLRATVGAGTVVMSLEARTAADSLRRVGRARYGMELPRRGEGVAISDVLLLVEPDPLPTTLEEALARMRGSARVRAGERLGLYWEVYGLAERPDTIGLSIQVRTEEAGWLRRAMEGLGLMAPPAPVRVRWEEETTGEEVLARSLLLALPELGNGWHSLELTVSPRGEEPVTVRRRILVEN